MMNFETAYDLLSEYVTEDTEALDLAFAIGGRTVETAEAILYYYTGWHNFEGYLAEINGEDEDEDEEDLDPDFDEADLEMGFDPYEGCYSYDC